MENKRLFDFVIGNPPYQEDTDGAGRQAKPVYNLFVEEAKKIEKLNGKIVVEPFIVHEIDDEFKF